MEKSLLYQLFWELIQIRIGMPWLPIPTQILIRQNDADPTDPDPKHCNTEPKILVNPSKKKKKEKNRN
jgi:hypothetical protein